LSADAIEGGIARIVRDELLLGSDRPIPTDAPLGELGVGLDSLALVSLLSAVESDFGVELPDDIWVARGPMSVGDLAEVVRRAPRTNAQSSTLVRTSPVLHGRLERVEDRLRRHGLAGRAAWTGVRIAAPVKRFLLSNTRHFLLERPLDEVALPIPPAPAGVELRHLDPGEETRISELWAPVHARRSQRDFEQALRNGAIALVACERGEIVAVDLLSANGDHEVDVLGTGACYGFYLTESRSARGRGIGLALVAFSFEVARERGFRAQLTHIWEGNTPMLVAATQLLGFQTIGVARRRRLAGFTRWSWIEEDGRRGRGPRLVLSSKPPGRGYVANDPLGAIVVDKKREDFDGPQFLRIERPI
jgi:acyl carrier protein/GNAT superfamily N-acetyltransferase